MKKASLFSGIGGIDLAAHWAGMETVVFCEREPFPQRVLRKHWPHVPIIDDVRNVTREELEKRGVLGNGRTIDIISAGYPCQPFSYAGKRRGAEDDRHLWPEVKRILEEIRPRWFVGENVAGHVTLGLDDVLADLGGAGYAAQAFLIPAAAVRASHRRDRVFIVAHSAGTRCDERISGQSGEIRDGAWREEPERLCSLMDYAEGERLQACNRKRRKGFAGPECDGQNVAHTARERCEEARECVGRSEEWPSGSGADVANSSCELPYRSRGEGRGRNEHPDGGEDVANTNDERREKRNSPTCCAGLGHSPGGVDAGGAYSARGAVKPGMGGSADEFSRWLDGSVVNPLDALADFISSYPQPALMGQPQYEWEPPRLATGVRNRAARLKALGNAVDPLQILPIMYAIKLIDDWLREGTA